MKVRNILFGCFLAMAAAIPLAAQTPLLGNIEAPYPNLQMTVRIAGATYGPGAVAYGPVGTPLILTGSDLGASGTVQFIGYKNGAVDPGTTVQASVTMWSSTMLFLTVPSGAVSGLVKVIAEGKTSVNGLPFIVTPGAYAGTCPASPPNNQLQIITSSLHDGTVGQAYSATLSASGGTTAYAWSLVGGTLPSGLSLNSSTGAVSGTPSSPAGPLDLTFQVVDSSSPRQNDQAVLSLTIESQTLTPATIYSYSATYDAVGNVTQYQDSIMGTWSFGYDSLNRLATGTPSSGPYNGQLACWSYDSFGNRTAQTFQTSACPTPETSVPATVSYNANNQVTWVQNSAPTGFSYDSSGNVTADNLNQYLYDADGRICAVNSTPIHGLSAMTGYIYDAEGNRVAKGTITTMSCDPTTNGFQLTESYVLGQGGEELTTLDGSNNWQRTNVYGAGKLLATYDATNGLHFHLTDPLGTRRMQVNGNLVTMGVPDTDIQSLPFGDGLYSYADQYASATADDATPLHFTGKERDSESGNDYFEARYYSSATGRFLSPDWSARVESIPYANLGNPQSLNLYAYMLNSPLDGDDEDGHDPRRSAVKKAWRQERNLVKQTGRGTRAWTAAERNELLQRGRVSGYEGHHINNVAKNPGMAGDPNNIEFLTRAEHLDAHGGNFANPTNGSLVSRAYEAGSLLPILTMFTGAAADIATTGMWSNPMNGQFMIGNASTAASYMESQGSAGGWGDGVYTFSTVSGFWGTLSDPHSYTLHDGAFWDGDQKVDPKALSGKAVQKCENCSA